MLNSTSLNPFAIVGEFSWRCRVGTSNIFGASSLEISCCEMQVQDDPGMQRCPPVLLCHMAMRAITVTQHLQLSKSHDLQEPQKMLLAKNHLLHVSLLLLFMSHAAGGNACSDQFTTQ